jgi:hypothetical protein
MNTFALHHRRHLAANGRNFLRIVAQIAVFTPLSAVSGLITQLTASLRQVAEWILLCQATSGSTLRTSAR